MRDSDRVAGARQDDPGAVGIVVLCTANVCRSPMAAALLARRLSELGVAARVRSAGVLRGGDPPYPEVISVMARYGVDVAGHRSRVAFPAHLAPPSLVLAVAPGNLRYARVAQPRRR